MERIFNEVNKIHNKIKFTKNEEKDNEIHFLDIAIHKNLNGSLGHKVYWKSSDNKYLHYNTTHPVGHKIAVIDTLVHRAFKLCDQENLTNELDYVTAQLIKCQYPKNLILTTIKLIQEKLHKNLPKETLYNTICQEFFRKSKKNSQTFNL